VLAAAVCPHTCSISARMSDAAPGEPHHELRAHSESPLRLLLSTLQIIPSIGELGQTKLCASCFGEISVAASTARYQFSSLAQCP